jgi:transposase
MRAADVDTESLPDDPAALRALLAAALARCEALEGERAALEAQNDRLRHLLLKLKRLQFGRKSERLPEEQLELGLADLETAIAEAEADAGKRDPDLRQERAARRRASRGALPAHLPRIEVVVVPDSTSCACCGGALVEIGADTSERLDVIPAQFRVIVTRRPKLACRACVGVVAQAPAPPRLVEGGLPTEATVAQVMVARYADHLPLYRQAGILARQGVPVDRSTLAAWVGTGAAEIAPVVRRLREITLGAVRLFADETAVPVLDPGRGKTKKGYFWAIARDDRSWGGTDPPAVVYTYAPGRGAAHAEALLGAYKGIVQCDGYAAYKRLAAPAERAGPASLAYCWSHVRRGFYDLARNGTSPIATEALRRIAALYAVEAEIRGMSVEKRHRERKARSRALAEDLFAWFVAQLARLPGGSPTAEPIRYALNHRDGLQRFLDDGRVDLDTNPVERAMRPVALGRKNALFASSDEGAENWAAVASLIETAKLNGVDPQRYLTDLLTRLVNGWSNSRIDELMPWRWATPATR